MRTKAMRSTALLLLLCTLTSCTLGKPANKPTDNESDKGDNTPASQMLRVNGEGYLENGEGRSIVLKGVNLGGWLLQESWMCAVVGSESNAETLRTLKERGFTDEQIKTLYESYIKNFITEKDIKAIADMGLNCIRVPFWYRNFMKGDCTFYSENSDDNFGFQILDSVISWARKYKIYVILDMHGAPGGQSTDHSTGDIGHNMLYTDEQYLLAAEKLWREIANRYKNEEYVAAYDILNEPMNNNSVFENGWAAGSSEAVSHTLRVYDRLIKAVRSVDKNHIITVEGIWSTSVLPDPEEYGWENMMYQLHIYDSSTEMIDYRAKELFDVRQKYKVAAYVGEFNNGDQNQMYAYGRYNRLKLSWTAWTYKASKGDLGNWSLFYKDAECADIKNDTYEQILEKWGSALETENYSKNTTLDGWLRTYGRR